jgi:hypothetical protein
MLEYVTVLRHQAGRLSRAPDLGWSRAARARSVLEIRGTNMNYFS